MKESKTQTHRSKKYNSAGNKKFEDGLPYSNKKQIVGFFIIVLGFLIILSILSYSPADQSVIENFNFKSYTSKENPSAVYFTFNWLGISGAFISSFFVVNGFGYFSVIIPFLLIIYGICLIRKKPLISLFQLSVYSLVFMIILSALFGLLRNSFGHNVISQSFVGYCGEFFSAITALMLGSLGSYILLFALLFLFAMLIFDRDIAKTFARIKLLYDGFKTRFKNYTEQIKQKHEEELLNKSARDSITNEREKIVRSKKIPKQVTDIEAEIKDTKINRPSGNELIAAENIDNDNNSKEINKSAEIIPLQKEINLKTENNTQNQFSADDNNFKDEEITESDNEIDYPDEILEDYKLPGLDLLDEPLKEELELISDSELKENGRLLQAKLLNFGVKIEKVIATPGPVVTLYELIPADDVKLSRIESLQDDIALAMKAKGIRMIIPMPGKGTVGVEIPNHNPVVVKIKSVVASKKFAESNMTLPIALGKTISGDVYVDDLAKMPHLLIAGSTGSGKSVGINSIITSLLYKLNPGDLKFLLIDPKKIELNLYDKLNKHYLIASKDYDEKIVTISQNAVLALKGLELEMERRYERLANATVRNIADYNKKLSEGRLKNDENIKHSKMPYIVVIIDELADLMITAAREIEEPIARLAQLARAVGIHLILATQRPSVDVITGVIKANFTARIAYLVNSKVDSRTILDMNGAEQLLGNGDMLYTPSGSSKPIRIQSPFISSDEVEKITDFIASQNGFSRNYELPSLNQRKSKKYLDDDERDELFEEAARIFLRYQRGSTSLLQRKLKIGYARAARIVDALEAANIIGPNDGSRERVVLVETEAQLEQLI
jgi:S-DNA-T family DNA segregation ATPase FtsK/SpoIIIE